MNCDECIAMLATEHRNQDAAATILTARASDPTGYGRVIRDKDDRVARIVEQTLDEVDLVTAVARVVAGQSRILCRPKIP